MKDMTTCEEVVLFMDFIKNSKRGIAKNKYDGPRDMFNAK
jgi:hypothetical protein